MKKLFLIIMSLMALVACHDQQPPAPRADVGEQVQQQAPAPVQQSSSSGVGDVLIGAAVGAAAMHMLSNNRPQHVENNVAVVQQRTVVERVVERPAPVPAPVAAVAPDVKKPAPTVTPTPSTLPATKSALSYAATNTATATPKPVANYGSTLAKATPAPTPAPAKPAVTPAPSYAPAKTTPSYAPSKSYTPSYSSSRSYTSSSSGRR